MSRHVFVTVSCNSSFDRTAIVMAASELSSKLLFSSPPFAKDSYGEKKEKICNLWKKCEFYKDLPVLRYENLLTSKLTSQCR